METGSRIRLWKQVVELQPIILYNTFTIPIYFILTLRVLLPCYYYALLG
jgi:hypothetical protein